MSGRPIPAAGTGDFPAPEGLWWLDSGLLDETANNYDLSIAAGVELHATIGTLAPNTDDGFGGMSLYTSVNVAAVWANRVNVDTAPLEGDANGNVTVCGLIRTEQGSSTLQPLAHSWSGAGDVPWILYGWGLTNRLPQFSYTDTGGTLRNISCPVRMVGFQWSFLVARRTVDPGVDCDIDFWVNGEKYSVPAQPEPSTTYAGTATFGVGRTPTASSDLRGTVGQVGVWDSALTDDECLALAQYVVPNLCRAA